jgi:anti-sigma28 factor (negative regulator of flagellin synthesis)
MQISNYETQRVLDQIRELRARKQRDADRPVQSVAELAKKHGVNPDEVRAHVERLMMQEEDPARERRVRELAARVADGSYDISSEEIIDMARRRAIADNTG